MNGISRHSDYKIATKLRAGLGWCSRSWLCPGPASLFQSTHWLFSVRHQLQHWTDGPEKLGVSQPKPFVYISPGKNSTTLNEKGEVDLWQPRSDLIVTFIHWLVPHLFLPWCSEMHYDQAFKAIPAFQQRIDAGYTDEIVAVLTNPRLDHPVYMAGFIQPMACF